MPRAAQDLAVPLNGQLGMVAGGRRGGGDAAGQLAGAEGAALVGANVAQRIKFAVDVKDADAGPAAKRNDDLALSRRNLPDFCDDDSCHCR